MEIFLIYNLYEYIIYKFVFSCSTYIKKKKFV